MGHVLAVHESAKGTVAWACFGGLKAGPKNSAHLSADVQILWNMINSGQESLAFWLSQKN